MPSVGWPGRGKGEPPSASASPLTQASVILAIAEAVAHVTEALRTASTEEAGSSNALGDRQLVADLETDAAVFAALRRCGAVALASSEESPADHDLGGSGYSVAFDPLDGSSIVGANWAVGSIFGVWPGSSLVGRTGREQAAAAYAVYGPRTLLVLARPAAVAADATPGLTVEEYELVPGGMPGGTWELVRGDIRLADSSNYFAPANLRATAGNQEYRDLVHAWMGEGKTLRYSGGMVPDVHHMLCKGGGVFCSPCGPRTPAKLRCLYELLPLSFVVEAAGGASHDGAGSVLDVPLPSHDARGVVALGSAAEVARCVPALRAGIA